MDGWVEACMNDGASKAPLRPTAMAGRSGDPMGEDTFAKQMLPVLNAAPGPLLGDA